jgi:hypothetical protein
MFERLPSARDYEILNKVGVLLDEARHMAARGTRRMLVNAQDVAKGSDALAIARALIYTVLQELVEEFAPRTASERELAEKFRLQSPLALGLGDGETDWPPSSAAIADPRRPDLPASGTLRASRPV